MIPASQEWVVKMAVTMRMRAKSGCLQRQNLSKLPENMGAFDIPGTKGSGVGKYEQQWLELKL